MNENMELVEHIYQDADMAVDNLTKLLEALKEKDNKIKSTIESILKEYEGFVEESKNELNENYTEAKEKGLMAKMSSKMGIKMEIANDNSDARVADMLIKGLSMGVIEMEKKINAYEKEVDHKHLSLAKKFLEFQNKSVEKLKEFL